MQEKAKFVIELDLDVLEETAEAFKRLDIEFDAVGDMIYIPEEIMRDIIFTGADMDEILTATNEYLNKKGDPHRLMDEFSQLTPKIRRDMMELLTVCTIWNNRRTVYDIQPDAWETFKRINPNAIRPA